MTELMECVGLRYISPRERTETYVYFGQIDVYAIEIYNSPRGDRKRIGLLARVGVMKTCGVEVLIYKIRQQLREGR